MRILVLGGTGFVGPHVVRRLHAQGHAVTIFHRGQTEVDLPPGIQHLHGDRAHLPTFAECFRSFAPMVYGPGDDQHRLLPHLKRMDDRRPAILLDERAATWRASHGYVESVAVAIALAVTNDRAAGRVYNVADAAVFTVQAWVEQVGKIAGWDGRIVVAAPDRLPSHLRRDGDWRQDWVVDATRARQELGWTEVVPVEEALRGTIAWERAHPPATIDPTQFDYEAEDAALAELGGAP